MTEEAVVERCRDRVLDSVLLSFLRRVAAAGHVSIVIPDEKAVLTELVARKLVLGNQLTDAGWKELGKASESKWLIPFTLPRPNDAEQAAQEVSTRGCSLTYTSSAVRARVLKWLKTSWLCERGHPNSRVLLRGLTFRGFFFT